MWLCFQECYEKVTLVYMGIQTCIQATLSNCGKIVRNIQYRSGIERSVQQHHRETCGYGKKLYGSDNPQPSSKGFYKPMNAVQRLNGSGRIENNAHKIESVHLETGSMRGIGILPYGIARRASGVMWKHITGANVSILQLNIFLFFVISYFCNIYKDI